MRRTEVRTVPHRWGGFGTRLAQMQTRRRTLRARDPDRPAALEQVPALDIRLRPWPRCEHRAMASAGSTGCELYRGYLFFAKRKRVGRTKQCFTDLRVHDLAEGRHVSPPPPSSCGHSHLRSIEASGFPLLVFADTGFAGTKAPVPVMSHPRKSFGPPAHGEPQSTGPQTSLQYESRAWISRSPLPLRHIAP